MEVSHTVPTLKPTFSFKSPIFLVLMAGFVLLSAVFFSLFFHLSAASRHHAHHPLSSSAADPVALACKSTRYPDLCQSSLNHSRTLPPKPTSLQIIQSAIGVSSQNLNNASSMVQSVIDSSSGNANLTRAAKQCLEGLGYADYRTNSTLDALSSGKNKDARAWMSAAVSYQFGCWGGLKTVNDTRQIVVETMSFLQTLTNTSSNALSMIFSYDNFGPDMGSWAPPKTERDGFYEGSQSGGGGWSVFELGVPDNLTANATVCKDGTGGCYKTVQDAVNAAPDNDVSGRFVIYIKEGVYEEIVRVPFVKKNVVFLGDGMGKTVITGSLNVGQIGMTTYDSATVGVLGDGFMASGLTFQNTAGPDAHQAVAFRSSSDFSVIEHCEFLGNQDTLYAHSLRQFYKKCRIQGNVDFIFGNSAAVFQDCVILVAPRQLNPEHGENNAVTAHGRSDPAQTTGFVFQNCLINGTEEYMKYYYSKPQVHRTFLGRPWKEFSRTVFLNSTLELLIQPEGWMPWSGDFALKTLFYGEYGNSGPGANVSQRVQWSSQIPEDRVSTYSVQNFIQGNEWRIQTTAQS